MFFFNLPFFFLRFISIFTKNFTFMTKLSIDRNSQIPLYLQAEKLLRELIIKDEYINGKLLPNEITLSEQLKISRNTLRQAINKLVFEGLLIRKKGYGTKVVRRGILGGAKNWLSFSQEMKAMGINIRNFELHISRKTVSDEVCRFFEIEPGSRLLSLERLRGKDDLPFVYFISNFSPEIPMTGDENFGRPLYEVLESDFHVVVNTSKEEINAQLADEFIAGKLEITTNDPILVRKRFVYDTDNRPVEYNIGYYRADSFTYTIETERKQIP